MSTLLHGLELAKNAYAKNFSIERLPADPTGAQLTYPRLWYNIPEKNWKYTVLDQNNDIIIKSFGDSAELEQAIADLHTELSTAILQVQNNLTDEIAARVSSVEALSAAINQLDYTPTAILYVSPNGPAEGADGSTSRPFRTLAAAIDAADPGSIIRVVGRGTYTDPLLIDKELSIVGLNGADAFAHTVVAAAVSVSATAPVRVQGVSFTFGPTQYLDLGIVGHSKGFHFKDCYFSAPNNAPVIRTDPDASGWEGPAVFEGCWVASGNINISHGQVQFLGSEHDSDAVLNVGGGDVLIRDWASIRRINHSSGILMAERIGKFHAPGGIAIESTASFETESFLALSEIRTNQPGDGVNPGTSNWIVKSGDCPYSVNALTRNPEDDIWVGEEQSYKQTWAQDVFVALQPQNYTTEGPSVEQHLAGLDAALSALAEGLDFIPLAAMGVPGGVATLDTQGIVPETQLPNVVDGGSF